MGIVVYNYRTKSGWINQRAGVEGYQPPPDWGTYVKDGEDFEVEVVEVNLDRMFEAHRGCDGSHCGLSDLYQINEEILLCVLELDLPDWDTGWWASKKEIASGRMSRVNGGPIRVRASVSDDFDTEGMGEAEVEVQADSWKTYEALMEAIGEAWDNAEGDQKENRQYHGFSIYPVDKKGQRRGWIETLILPIGEFVDFEGGPPGDEYHQWGFQNEPGNIFAVPADVREQMEHWAWQREYGKIKERSAVFKSRRKAFYRLWNFSGRGGCSPRHRNTTKKWMIEDWDANEES